MRWLIVVECLLAVAVEHGLSAEQLVYVSLNKEQKIAVYDLNVNDSSLTLKKMVDVTGHPASTCVDRDKKHLYVSMKQSKSLAAFRIAAGGGLVLLGESIVGEDAAYVTVHPSGKYLLSADYANGLVHVHGIHSDATLSDNPLQVMKTDKRAHAIVHDLSGNFFFVPHTQPNAIFQFVFDADTGKLLPNTPAKLQRENNTGPRHLSFHPGGKFAYGSDEQGCSVTVYRFDPESGTLKAIQTVSSLPTDGFSGKRSTSHIEVHPSGKFVYIANRGHDTIAGFSINPESGDVTLLQHTPTEAVPRSFNISPDGKHLIAAGQSSGKLAVFRIAEDGMLSRTATVGAGNTPWWVLIVER
jgi:6-phosphogluconolactonase